MDLNDTARDAAGHHEGVAIAIEYGGEKGGWRQHEPYYPASVVKLLYLDYTLHHFPVRATEFERGVRDMIVESSNDATALVVDTITGTTGGPELSPADLSAWMKKRQRVNEWFRILGHHRINACQKTWNEAPYGREKQGYGPNNELRNSLTAFESLSILRETLERHPEAERYLLRRKGDAQHDEFLGPLCPLGWDSLSKAGWTSEVRHDAAFFRAPQKEESLGLAVFTVGASDNAELIPSIGRRVMELLGIQAR
ncbi:serine hydrolase [soil metagenome]